MSIAEQLKEIQRLQNLLRASTIIRNILFVIMIVSGIVVIINLIKNRGKAQLFDYYFDYYDADTGKFIYSEKISKEEYYRSSI